MILGGPRSDKQRHHLGLCKWIRRSSCSCRKSWDLKCSKPNPGPPVVSISTTREIPIASGLPGQEVATRGAAAGAGAGVAKLRGARERKRAESGKCEGRKSWAEINPDLVRRSYQAPNMALASNPNTHIAVVLAMMDPRAMLSASGGPT